MASDVRERPILFNGEMVRAILAGTKTQTRRIVTKGTSAVGSGRWEGLVWSDPGRSPWVDSGSSEDNPFCPVDRCQYLHVPDADGDRVHRVYPRIVPGDRLWVRETWSWHADGDFDYRATWPTANHLDEPEPKWCPSIHMPRWASRIMLEVTDVRVERVQDISEADAKAEGAEPWLYGHGPTVPSDGNWSDRMYRDGFMHLWDSINGKREGCSWEANPWCWAVSFRRVDDGE